jgi:hypothetical protein
MWIETTIQLMPMETQEVVIFHIYMLLEGVKRVFMRQF